MHQKKSIQIQLGRYPQTLKNLPDLKHNFNFFYWEYNNNILKVIRLSQSPVCPAELRHNASGTTTFLWSTHCHVAGTVKKFLNRNGFGERNDTNQGRRVFFILLIFWGLFTRKDHLTHHNIFKYIYFHDSYQ
jgi:hypothetical protein